MIFGYKSKRKIMKAIVRVSKKSAYSVHNGLTYPVKEILGNIIALDINGKTVDFTYREILIVDFATELQKSYDLHNWNGSGNYIKLCAYMDANKINVKLSYNCPA
jgi:hypothetical protein